MPHDYCHNLHNTGPMQIAGIFMHYILRQLLIQQFPSYLHVS